MPNSSPTRPPILAARRIAASVPSRGVAASRPASSSATKPNTVKSSAKSAPVADKAVSPKDSQTKAPKAAATKAPKEKPTAAKLLTATPKSPAKLQSPAAPTAKPVEASATKARRLRAPKNLAAQYGETETKREIVTSPAETKRARRTAKEREQRRAAMAVDEALLNRLAQAGSGATLVIGEEEEEAPKVKRRSPIWEVRCGKCGMNGRFKKPAALCEGCGTILVRFDN